MMPNNSKTSLVWEGAFWRGIQGETYTRWGYHHFKMVPIRAKRVRFSATECVNLS
jgi:hypothetical protein